MLNDKVADKLFLQRCRDEDSSALARWEAESYWMAVAGKIRETLIAGKRGEVDLRIVTALTITCTELIYDLHDKLPSRIFGLKIMVRWRAGKYTKRYLRDGGSLRIDE